ncbi:hypothetical protein [Micromonospora sp. NPDC048887]|uniref:hypothetical protein n=1 Tax=Micromonospora sp. NPDC048887 TaxID=3155614 RepID=UPI0033D15537
MSPEPPPRPLTAALARHLAPLAARFYARRPYVDEGHSYLLGRQTAALDPSSVAAHIIEPLVLLVCFFAEDDDLGQRRIVARRVGDKHHADPISRADFEAMICDLLAALPDPPTSSGLLAQAVADTRSIAAFGCSGRPRRKVAKWIARVVDNVLCAMEDEDEPADVEVIWRASLRSAEANAKRADTLAARRAAKVAAAEQAADHARAFVAALAPGRHEVPAVWAAYCAATSTAERLGKHAFLALGRELLGDPRKVRGARLWHVPEAADAASRPTLRAA